MLNQDVIYRFSQGDAVAFEQVYMTYQQTVFNNIYRILSSIDTEDLLQDVFFKLWESRQRFLDEEHIASWLFTVSYNLSISHLRKSVRELKLLHANDTRAADQQAAHSEDTAEHFIALKEQVLSDAIRQLPKRKREVIELCKLQGKSYAEASVILGITPDTVKEHMTGALKSIKIYVGQRQKSLSTLGFTLLCFYLQP